MTILTKPFRVTWLIRNLLVFAALFAQWGVAGGAVINDIRMWHAPDRSRIVLDMDESVDFREFTLGSPDRVVLDLPRTKLAHALPDADATGQFIRRIRKGHPVEGVLRLVFDLEKPVRYVIRLFRPVDHYQYRLVMDYYPWEPATGTTQPEKREPRGDRKKDLLILIDPGHGGEDPGALGRKTQEKKVVLAIAKKLKEKVDREPGMRAQLTREGDYYVGLRKRIGIARRLKADLFISIHADAFKDKNVHGSSVYALSQRGATSESARWLANKENASDLMGGVILSDKEDMLANTMIDMSMTKTVNESLVFGRKVLDELMKIGPVHSRRVEQAGFVVLKSPDIPSILVETAYITNSKEEKLLLSEKHQHRISNAVLAGIREYLKNSPNIYADY